MKLSTPRRKRPIRKRRIAEDTRYDFTSKVHRVGLAYIAIGPNADIWGGKWDLEGKTPKSLVIKSFRGVDNGSHSSRKLFESLLKEAPKWREQSHKNITIFLGVVKNTGGQFPSVVMQRFKNGNVLDYLKTHPQAEKLRIVRDIALGLRHLHTLDPPVVHGNLKATNVFVREDGSACIGDVGLASVLDENDFYTTNSSSRFRWLAPEILSPNDEAGVLYTVASDMYAFAMTVIEIYTEERPFQNIRHDGAVILRVLQGVRPLRPASMPDRLWMLIEQCWNQDSEKRPSIEGIMDIFE